MTFRSRAVDYLAAASLVVAFGCLFLGRMMIYPVARAHGAFLERVAAESTAWDLGHRVMLIGMVGLIPAALSLWRALRDRSPWLAGTAAACTMLGAALGVGQYALDFAMLAAPKLPPAAGQAFVDEVRGNTFVAWAFYKLPDVAQLGLLLIVAALWRQGAGWRVPAALVTVAVLTALIAPQLVGAAGVRLALGLSWLGFTAVAWRIAAKPAP